MVRCFLALKVAIYTAFIAAGILGSFSPVSAQSAPGDAYLIHLDGIIDPNHAKYLKRALGNAEKAEAQFAIVRIDTPGGTLSSMRDMVKTIFAAEIPVITFVGPQGARAGSAGTFISAAGHIAFMAPGTNIGAATPISGTGEDLPDTLADKVTNDTAALIRSIAASRDRNGEALERTVREAASFSASEALELNIIDLIADDLDDLIAQLDGRTITVGQRDVTLQTSGIRCDEPRLRCTSVGLSWSERFIDVIADPTISGLLLSLGTLGLFLELFNPGLIFPGVLGVLALVVAFVAFGNLPVNWAGVGLIVFAIVLLFAEVQVSGLGILGAGGIISLALGFVFLFNDPPSISGPSISIDRWVVIGVPSGFGLVFGMVAVLAWRGNRNPPPTFEPSLIGMTGRVTTDLDPVGTIQVGGELWSAEEERSLFVPAGERVEVVAKEGLTLRVTKKAKLLSEGGGHALAPGSDV